MGSCLSIGLNTGNSHLDEEFVMTSGVLTNKRKATSAPEPPEILQAENLKSFSFDVLKRATRNFHPESELGEGRFSSVFKGWIDEQSLAPAKPGTGTAVAVKMYNDEFNQNAKEWLADMDYFARLKHQNLVRLIGYCLEGDRPLLVYEFMCRGSLANHLFIRGSHFQCLSWNLRIKVALDVAKGLAYLHSTEPNAINLYLKSSNILIDYSYNAKLSDFAMAKRENSERRVMIFRDNIAPEFMCTGYFRASGEIYHFGVVLLELVTGRRSFEKNAPSGEELLVKFAMPFLSNKQNILCIMDSSIKGQYSSTAVKRVGLLAKNCLKENPIHRPNVDELVKELELIQESQKASKSSINDLVCKDNDNTV